MSEFTDLLNGAVIMGPMTKGSNLPYRRLCDEMGATITMGEMALARKLKRNNNSEFALIRRAPEEKVFGVQLAGNQPDEMAWAAALAEERGADLVDVNLGCPIHDMTRRGLGAAMLQKPARIGKVVEAMVAAVTRIPVTVKIRLGYTDDKPNFLEVARVAVEAGASAVALHGRSRTARYRKPSDWDAVQQLVASVSVPVIGNGDILDGEDIARFRERSGCSAVMIARGALIKPWIFREATGVSEDPSAEDRVAIYRRYVELARAHWGEDEKGTRRIRGFLLWHLDFWHRYRPPTAEGQLAKMQEREHVWAPRNPLEALLARGDEAAWGFLAEHLLQNSEIPMDEVPEPGEASSRGGQERSWES